MSANPCPSCGNPDPGGLTCDVCGIDLIEMPPEDWGEDAGEAKPNPTPEQFLSALAGEFRNWHDRYLWVCGFNCEPSEKAPWGGRPINGKGAMPDPRENGYFSVGIFRTSKSRSKPNQAGAFVIVLDDIDTDGLNDLPLHSSYIVETSPGNHHVGFLVTDQENVTGYEILQKRLIAAGQMKADKNGNSSVRYVRLPGYINNKPEIIAEHGEPFVTRLVELAPERRYTVAELAHYFGVSLDEAPKNTTTPSGEERESDAELMRQILTGDGYHDALLKLAARYAQHGNMDRGEAVGLLQGAMLANPDRSPRWKDRYKDIPRTVASAWEKFRKPQASSGAPTGFRFVPVRDLLSQPAPIEYLVRNTIEAGSLCQLFGASTAGKSFVALDWCACIACGVDWHDKTTRQGTVFYIAGEGHAGLGRRMRAWEIQNEIALADAPLFFSTAPAALMDAGNAANVAEAVKALAAEHGAPALIVVDTLARNLGNGEESSNSDIGTFINNIDVMLRRAFDCSVLIVHHSGWQESHRSRGASALRAAMDHEFRLDMFDNGSRELHVTKSKEGEIPPPMPLELKQVALTDWCTPDGEIMTSAVMVPTDRVEGKRKENRLKGARKIAFDSLNITLTRDGEPASEDIKKEFGLLTPARVVHEDVWREHTYNAGISDGETDAKKKAFQRARKDLIDQGFVVTWNGYYWPFGSPLGLTGQNGTLPGHVPPVPHDKRDKTGHTSIEVSRCPGADTEMSDSSEKVQ